MDTTTTAKKARKPLAGPAEIARIAADIQAMTKQIMRGEIDEAQGLWIIEQKAFNIAHLCVPGMGLEAQA